jgi:LasA protease
VLLAALACASPNGGVDLRNITPVGETTAVWLAVSPGAPPTPTVEPPTAPVPGAPTPTPWPTQDALHTPTPDATRPSILERQAVEEYTVRRGDYLSAIGEHYGVSANEIAEANGIAITDTLHVGQVLRIPVPNPNDYGPALKLLPDSEYVDGPGAVGFNLQGFVDTAGGYLARYTEDVPGAYLDGSTTERTLTGAEIVQTVADRYSISPRVLLALLEYQSRWVTQRAPHSNTLAYPLGWIQPGREGLFRQLAWAANQLNYGYYTWRVGSVVSWSFEDGSIRLIAPGLNAGSVAVQHFFAQVLEPGEWEKAVGVNGFSLAYQALFGNPFSRAFEPLVPAALTQPALQLPFEPGKPWAFTGGPHGAWDTGSAWAALDFAPPGEPLGCVESDEWVVAAAPGLIVRAADGAVLEDLDGDGYEQTGWVLFYMHIESRGRVEAGARVNAGDRLGHPSCEGGVSNGTHVHFARKYNGEWISADRDLPFVLDGWVSAGLGREYDGTLSNGETSVEACNCRADTNEVSRP